METPMETRDVLQLVDLEEVVDIFKEKLMLVELSHTKLVLKEHEVGTIILVSKQNLGTMVEVLVLV